MRMTSLAVATLLAGTAALVAIPASAAPGECTYVGATTWNVKESFNNYIEGVIANGPQYDYAGGIEVRDGIVTTGEKATRSFAWPVTSVEDDRITHTGGIHYTGHNKYDGADPAEAADYFSLDNDFSNLTIEVSGQSGRILLDYVSREFVDTSTVGQERSGTQVEVATIDFSSPVDLTTNGTVTAVGTTELTDSGYTVFGGFYEVGAELADVELNLRVSGCGAEAPPTPDAPETPVSGSSLQDVEAGVSQVLTIGTMLGLGGLALSILGYIIHSAQNWMV